MTHVNPTPDPALTLEGLSTRIVPTPDQSRYGTATTDPLGRTVDHDESGNRFKDGLPRHPCPRCPGRRVPRAAGHKGGHDDEATP